MFSDMTTMPVGPAGSGLEVSLLHTRTHPKILFKPFMVQAFLLAAHVAMFRYFPESTGVDVVDSYAELIIHGLLGATELWFAVLPVVFWYHSRFEVTDRRVRMRWGVLYKHSREIHLDRITQIGEERGILDRIFRCGTIVIYDAANASAIRFHDVPKFHDVRTTIDDARHAAHTRVPHQPVVPAGDPW